MKKIELDASNWKTELDFYKALLSALGAPEWHGSSIDALIDSMIWGDINAIVPPYVVELFGTSALPRNVTSHIKLAKNELAEAREYFQASTGGDVDVSLQIVS